VVDEQSPRAPAALGRRRPPTLVVARAGGAMADEDDPGAPEGEPEEAPERSRGARARVRTAMADGPPPPEAPGGPGEAPGGLEEASEESDGEAEVAPGAVSQHSIARAKSRETISQQSFLHKPTCAIKSRQDLNGITWYEVQVTEGSEERSYLKRYSDFRRLHEQLLADKAKVQEMPQLPTKGVLGVRHKLNLGNFNDKRQEDLQEYLRKLLAQLRSVAEESALDAFFARETAKHIAFPLADGDRAREHSVLEHALGSGVGSAGAHVLRTATDVEGAAKPAFGEKDQAGEGGEAADILEGLAAAGVGVVCRKGQKPGHTNQDSFCILHKVDMFSTFGVFDGHGPFGHDVSNFAAPCVMKLFAGHAARDTEPEEALRFAFIETQNMLEELSQAGEINASLSGCTGTLISVAADRKSVHAAHVGDSRAVLCRSRSDGTRGGVAVDLTEDHKVNLPKEQSRIEAAGGVVKFDGQINHRVWNADGRGGLCVSRVLGDTVMHGSGVIAVPEIRRVDLNLEGHGYGRGRDLFVLLCSDGVWEFMTSQEACDLVLSYGRDDVQGAIAELARRSRDLWLQDDPCYVDDITAVVAWL
ncbi:unnamed protein product, partial [Prorocentrum cordatum]